MKWFVYRLIAQSRDSKKNGWVAYLVSIDRKRFYLAYSAVEKRFSRSTDMKMFLGLPCAAEIMASIEEDCEEMENV